MLRGRFLYFARPPGSDLSRVLAYAMMDRKDSTDVNIATVHSDRQSSLEEVD